MSDFSSLIFYISSFVLSFIFYLCYEKGKGKFFLGLSFLIPMFIGGLRYNVGTDYMSYVALLKYNANVDFGFSLISYVTKMIGNYQVLFFIYNFLTILFVFAGMKNCKKEARPLVYFIYLFLVYTSGFNSIRQSLAIAIVFYAYKYIVNKNVKKWLFFSILASIFHNTAVICIPFYFIFTTKKNYLKFVYLVLTFIASSNYIEIINFLTSKISFFSHFSIYANKYTEAANNKMFFVDIMVLIYIIFNKKKLNEFDKCSNMYFYMFLIYIALEFTGFFNPFIKRIGNYFIFSKILLLGSIPYSMKSMDNKYLSYVLIMLFSILIFIISAYILKQSDVIPYHFISNII